MRIISKKKLKEFWEAYPDSIDALQAWYAEVKAATWNNPIEIKEKDGSASILKDSRVVFNICGNNYRLVVKINYPYSVVYVRFVGTHKEYDTIDAEVV